ncbi:MAG TPA: OB-fold domain-containing protein [Acidimicrobiales bacterium]|jgi:hypothetical protein
MSERPLPVRDEGNEAYWDGAQDEKLVLLRCAACGTYVHPPTRTLCPSCRSEELEASAVSGRGTVYSWSVMHSGGNPGFEAKIPYTVLVVELVEQRGLITIGNLVDGDPANLAIGTPVEVCFEKVNDEVTLPQWRLVPVGDRA